MLCKDLPPLGPEPPARDTLLGWRWGKWTFANHTSSIHQAFQLYRRQDLLHPQDPGAGKSVPSPTAVELKMLSPCFRGGRQLFFSLQFTWLSFFVRTFFFFIIITINSKLLKIKGIKMSSGEWSLVKHWNSGPVLGTHFQSLGQHCRGSREGLAARLPRQRSCHRSRALLGKHKWMAFRLPLFIWKLPLICN